MKIKKALALAMLLVLVALSGCNWFKGEVKTTTNGTGNETGKLDVTVKPGEGNTDSGNLDVTVTNPTKESTGTLDVTVTK
jgi:hypothetical protein